MILNKYLFLGILITLFSFDSHALNRRSVIIKTPAGTIVVPSNKKDELKGQGIIFNSTVKVFVETKDGEIVKTYRSWVRGCGEVDLPSKEKDDKSIKSGDRVELRFDRAGSCKVVDWKKF